MGLPVLPGAEYLCSWQPIQDRVTPGTACTNGGDDARRAAAELRALCLAPAEANDSELTALVREAEASDARARWTALADAWIAKARRSYDEGYYLHAGACAELAWVLTR